jgi:hypothetical protein
LYEGNRALAKKVAGKRSFFGADRWMLKSWGVDRLPIVGQIPWLGRFLQAAPVFLEKNCPYACMIEPDLLTLFCE